MTKTLKAKSSLCMRIEGYREPVLNVWADKLWIKVLRAQVEQVWKLFPNARADQKWHKTAGKQCSWPSWPSGI